MYKHLIPAAVLAAALAPLPVFAVDFILTTGEGDCVLPLQGGSNVVIDPTSGNVQGTLSGNFNPANSGCSIFGGTAKAPSFSALFRVNGAGSYIFPSSSAGSVNLTWTAVDAAYCENYASILPTTVTNWPATGTVMPVSYLQGNPRQVTFPSNGTVNNRVYTLGLRCVGIVNPAVTGSVQITVPAGGGEPEPPPPAPGCGNITSPPGFTQAVSTSVRIANNSYAINDATKFGRLFRSQSDTEVLWPGAGTSRWIRIPKDRYLAAQFTIPYNTIYNRWELRTESSEDDYHVVPTLITVSKCPGHFDVSGPNAIDSRCVWQPVGAANRQFQLVVDASTYQGGSRCPLEFGATYYMNMIHMDKDTKQSTCGGGAVCSWFGESQGYTN